MRLNTGARRMWLPSAPGVQISAGRLIPAGKARHDTTLGAIVEAIASRNRLEASVAPSLAGIKIPAHRPVAGV